MTSYKFMSISFKWEALNLCIYARFLGFPFHSIFICMYQHTTYSYNKSIKLNFVCLLWLWCCYCGCGCCCSSRFMLPAVSYQCCMLLLLISWYSGCSTPAPHDAPDAHRFIWVFVDAVAIIQNINYELKWIHVIFLLVFFGDVPLKKMKMKNFITRSRRRIPPSWNIIILIKW